MEELIKQMQLASRAENMRKNGTVPRAIRRSHLTEDSTAANTHLIYKITQAISNLSDFYARRDRAHRYFRGDHYKDYTVDDDGNRITEEDLIRSRNKIPMKNNMIESIVNNLVGQYRQSAGKSTVTARKKEQQKVGEMLTNTLQTVYDLNEIKEMDANALKEGLISGVIIQKITFSPWKDRDQEDLMVVNPNPGRVFFNGDIKDVRLLDLSMIGELHDLKITDVISSFAKTDEDMEKIRRWYRHINEQASASYVRGLSGKRPTSVIMSEDPNLCRVIEVWEHQLVRRMREHDTMKGTLRFTDRNAEDIELENAERVAVALQYGIDPVPVIHYEERFEFEWGVKFLTPLGQVLYEGPSPYHHKSHPYVVRFTKFVNGEVWGVVESVIDQQRNINRYLTMLDFISGAAAKGVLLVAEESIPDDMNLDDMVDQWSRFDGVIKYKAKAGVTLPQQVVQNSVDIGINEQLATQFQLIEKISGVNGSIQGHEAKSGTPSSLYAQQTMNASTNSRDVFEAFTNFKKVRDMKALKVITQFYKEERYLSIVGSDYDEEARIYDPAKLTDDLEYDVVSTDGVDTPAYRMLMDEQLNKLLELNLIELDEYLEQSNYPFSNKLLEARRKKMDNQSQMQLSQESPPADPAKMAQVQQMLGVK